MDTFLFLSFEDPLSTSESITLIIGLLTALVLIYQVYQAKKAIKKDHLRRKNQATFDYIIQIKQQWEEGRKIMDEIKEQKNDNADDPFQHLMEVDEEYQKIRDFLNMLEHLSVGVNTDVFSDMVIYRMEYSRINAAYQTLNGFIKKVRQEKNQTTAYCEFEKLTKRINQLKQKDKMFCSSFGFFSYFKG